MKGFSPWPGKVFNFLFEKIQKFDPKWPIFSFLCRSPIHLKTWRGSPNRRARLPHASSSSAQTTCQYFIKFLGKKWTVLTITIVFHVMGSAWIEDFNIKPYHEYKDQFTKACKSRAFLDACQAIEKHIANPPVNEICQFCGTINTWSAGFRSFSTRKSVGYDRLTTHWMHFFHFTIELTLFFRFQTFETGKFDGISLVFVDCWR